MPNRCSVAPSLDPERVMAAFHIPAHPYTLQVCTACTNTSNRNHRRQQLQHATHPQPLPNPVIPLSPEIAVLPSPSRRHPDFRHYGSEGTRRCSQGSRRARKIPAMLLTSLLAAISPVWWVRRVRSSLHFPGKRWAAKPGSSNFDHDLLRLLSYDHFTHTPLSSSFLGLPCRIL